MKANAIMAAVLAILLTAAPIEAKKKKAEKFRLYNLKAHPTSTQKMNFAMAKCDLQQYLEIRKSSSSFVLFSDFCMEQKREDFQSEVLEYGDSFLLDAEILVHEDSRALDVLLGVKNDKEGRRIEVLPQKVFLVDDLGRAHLPVLEYEAKAAIAAKHRLPPFSPPTAETYYTISQVPLDSRAPVAPDPAQPQFTIFETQAAPHSDYSGQLGYEIGYLLRAWLNKRDAKKQMTWIDENWFNHKQLGPGESQTGYLMFEDVLETPFKAPSPPKPSSPADDWVDEILRSATAQPDRSLNLVIFVQGQQFVFRFGPEIAEQKNP